MVIAYSLPSEGEVWILGWRDSMAVRDSARHRARVRGIELLVPMPLIILWDDGDGAVCRVQCRLERWKITSARFRDCPESRAELAVIEREDLRRRQMI
jgi:hypothetical protein